MTCCLWSSFHHSYKINDSGLLCFTQEQVTNPLPIWLYYATVPPSVTSWNGM